MSPLRQNILYFTVQNIIAPRAESASGFVQLVFFVFLFLNRLFYYTLKILLELEFQYFHFTIYTKKYFCNWFDLSHIKVLSLLYLEHDGTNHIFFVGKLKER